MWISRPCRCSVAFLFLFLSYFPIPCFLDPLLPPAGGMLLCGTFFILRRVLAGVAGVVNLMRAGWLAGEPPFKSAQSPPFRSMKYIFGEWNG